MNNYSESNQKDLINSTHNDLFTLPFNNSNKQKDLINSTHNDLFTLPENNSNKQKDLINSTHNDLFTLPENNSDDQKCLINSSTNDFKTKEFDELSGFEALRIDSESASERVLTAEDLTEYILNNYKNKHYLLTVVMTVIKSADLSEDIQEELIDVLGIDNLYIIEKILTNRKNLKEEISEKYNRRLIQKNNELNYTLTEHKLPTSLVNFQKESDKKLRKKLIKKERQLMRNLGTNPSSYTDFLLDDLTYKQSEIILDYKEKEDIKKASKLSLAMSKMPKVNYPYVFDSSQSLNYTNISFDINKFSLPEGSKSIYKGFYQEVYVPPTIEKPILPENFNQIQIDALDSLAKSCFENFKCLNTIQSIVFQQCYTTHENILMCAPTGAGKTNVAMLAILKTINDHLLPSGEIDKKSFKIVYLAPMKALASEMTQNFGKRLGKIGLKVRELTGDTQLSKKEIQETQMLILTPEKWDVLTRKADDEALNQLLRLIIIDEVHLLHDDRGPVIETIVARTFRQIENLHQNIRIVGLSATLPNYIDVAHFLRVDPMKGLFYFDSRFRPVPLAQTFVGVYSKNSNREYVNNNVDKACYEKAITFLRENHQVLIFVHSRNLTTSLSKFFIETCKNANEQSFFLPNNVSSIDYLHAIKRVKSAKSREIKELFSNGIGIHHAGILRCDRNLIEKLFADGHIRLLICTATLAWGINLPAHAVIIRGTEIYNPQKGKFTDIGVLDVQQIFGRAGRPQYESFGHGVIITSADKVPKYLEMLVRQSPIESQFHTKILDNLNAEIVKGTVTNIKEAVEWLRMTYYYIRVLKNPLEYGIDETILCKDKTLELHFSELCYNAAKKLDYNQMIVFDSVNGYLSSTDLGRIASHFYITFETIETFNDQNRCVKLTNMITDDKILNLICSASEFSQITSRDNEMQELQELTSFGCVFSLKSGSLGSTEGKVNVLLQSYISRRFIDNFALVSESFYISQNATRIARALFQIVLRRGWAQATSACLQISKAIERRIWPFQSPLRQLIDFYLLKESTVSRIESSQMSIDDLWEMEAKELGSMFSCDGFLLYNAIHMIPIVGVDASIKPITRSIVQIEAYFLPNFIWNDKLLQATHKFWIFVEDIHQNLILHYEEMIITKKKVIQKEKQKFLFIIPIHEDQIKNQFQIRVAHDSFIVEDTILPLTLHNCILPSFVPTHTDLLDLDPLPITALKNDNFERLYSFKYFNPIQTQVFFTLYETDKNTLIGAPTSSGKTLCAELAIFRLLKKNPTKKCVYIAPLKALVRERVLDWHDKFANQLNFNVVEVSGDNTPFSDVLNSSTILITTPEKWDGITRCMETREYVKNVELMIIDEIHLLGVERGAVLEAIITRTKLIQHKRFKSPIRIVGLSTALANANDVGEWINVDEFALYNFRPSVRPVPIDVHIQGFPGHHYCPRMELMNKPAYKAIRQFSDTKPALVFVASRRQTRLTAMAFISLLALEENSYRHCFMEQTEKLKIIDSIKDENLKMTLSFGIGIHHAGLQHFEREIVEKLFLERKIQILVATSTLAWGINVPAHLVVIKGTEYYDGKTHKYVDFPVTDVLQMIGRAGRPQFDSSAVAVVFVQNTKKNFYKKFLYESFPVESSLLPVLPNHVNAEICSGLISSKQGILDYLAGTYLYRRFFANPSYYFINDLSTETITLFLNKLIDNCVDELLNSKCILINDNEYSIESTSVGVIASKYYLNHLTVRHFSETLTIGLSLEELIKILADCSEYDEIPVRHNEENTNQEIHNNLPVKLNTNEWDSPHTKVHLLYQAHFSRYKLPVDYITDQRSVIESCVRIIQAMFDYCVIFNLLDTAINVIILMQQIYQAKWYYNHPLSCLPVLTDHSIEGLGPLLTIPQFKKDLAMHNLSKLNSKEHNNIINKLMKNSILNNYEAKKVVDALLKWPNLLINEACFQQGLNKWLIDITMFDPPKDNSNYINLTTSTQYKIRLLLEQICSNMETAFCPKFSKQKVLGWIVIIGERTTRKIYSSQKFNFLNGRNKKYIYLPFTSPSMPGRYCFTIYVMSDCYLGIDQEYNIHCDVKNSF